MAEPDYPDDLGLPGEDSFSDEPVKDVVANFLIWLLRILGTVALISFVVAGLQYLLASGDEETIKNAKRHMTYSIIGIAVALSGYVIIKAIDLLLRAESTTI